MYLENTNRKNKLATDTMVNYGTANFPNLLKDRRICWQAMKKKQPHTISLKMH